MKAPRRQRPQKPRRRLYPARTALPPFMCALRRPAHLTAGPVLQTSLPLESMRSAFMNERNASGITTLPSACW
jgi:hypothetical protein